MKIVIVGAGEVGRYVAKMLSNENHDITIMDESEDRLQDLDTNYDIMSRVGSPTSVNDLRLRSVPRRNISMMRIGITIQIVFIFSIFLGCKSNKM